MMKNPLKTGLRVAIEKSGFRIFPKERFYRQYLPYGRFGSELIHHLRHFVDVAQIKTCFDIGANHGQTAHYFSAVFPAATIYSFEPISRTYSSLVSATNGLPRVKPFNFALGSAKGETRISLAEDDQTNTLVTKNPREISTAAPTELIRIHTVDAFMTEQNVEQINVLKTDTEGFDLEVLRGANGAFAQNRIDFVYCEVCFDPTDKLHTYFDDVLRFLAERNLVFLGLYETVYCGTPTRLFHANALFGRKTSPLLREWAD